MSYIHRAPITESTKEAVRRYAEITQVNENGETLSPNGTRKAITDNTKLDIGHRNGFENRYEIEFSEKAGLSQEEHNALFTNPGTFQLEPHDENISHVYECKDYNEGMQNVAAYAYSQDRSIAARTYINPSEDGKSGTISIKDENGNENVLCTYGDTNGDELSSANDQSECDTDKLSVCDTNELSDCDTDNYSYTY